MLFPSFFIPEAESPLRVLDTRCHNTDTGEYIRYLKTMLFLLQIALTAFSEPDDGPVRRLLKARGAGGNSSRLLRTTFMDSADIVFPATQVMLLQLALFAAGIAAISHHLVLQ